MSDLNLGTLIVELMLDPTHLSKGAKEAKEHLEELSSSIKPLAAALGEGLALAAEVGLGATVEAASKASEAQIRLATALKATGQAADLRAFEELGDAIQRTTTFSEVSVTAAAALGTRLGLSREQVEKLTPSVADLAASMGGGAGSLEHAMFMVGKAIETGQIGPLTRAGVILSQHDQEQFKLMTTAERTAAVMDKLGNSVGGMASALTATAGGAFAQMQNALEKLAETVGAIFEPTVVAALQSVTSALVVVKDFFAGMSDAAKKWVLVGTFVVLGLLQIGAALTALVVFLPELLGIFAAFAIVGPVLLGIAAAVAGIAFETYVLDQAFQRMGITADDAFNSIDGAAESAFAAIEDAVARVAEVIVLGIPAAFSDAFGVSIEPVQKFFDYLKELVGGFAHDLFMAVTLPLRLLLKFQLAPLKLLEGAREAIGSVEDKLAAAKAGMGAGGAGAPSSIAEHAGATPKTGFQLSEGEKWYEAIMAQQTTTAPPEAPPLSPVEINQALEKAFGPLVNDVVGPDLQGVLGWGGKVDAAYNAAVDVFGSNVVEGAIKAAGFITDHLGVVADTLGEIGAGLASKMGDAGSVFSSVFSAGQQGGAPAAIATAAIELLSRTKAFAKLSEIANKGFGDLVKAFEPLTNALIPMAQAARNLLQTVSAEITPVLQSLGTSIVSVSLVLRAIAPLFEALAPAFEAVGLVVEGLGRVVAAAAAAMLVVVLAHAEAWNAIINVLVKFVKAIDKIPGVNLSSWIDKLNEAKVSTKGLKDALGDLSDVMMHGAGTFSTALDHARESMQANTREANRITDDTASAVDDLGDAANKAVASLLNVPQGFKIALARFNAIVPDVPQAAPGDPMIAGTAGAPQVHVDRIIIQSNNAQEIAAALQKIFRWDRYAQTGSSAMGSQPFAVPRT